MSNKLGNILFVTAHFPYPIIGGERVKEFAILKELSKNYSVTLVSLDRGYPVTQSDVDEIKNLGIEVHLFRINKCKAYLKGIFNFFSVKPLETSVFITKQLKTFIVQLIKTHNFSLIINFFLRTSELVRDVNLPKILILDDCRSLYQKRTGTASKNIFQKILRLTEAKKLLKYESKIVNDFNSITFVSEYDLKHFPKNGNPKKLIILPHPIDTDKFIPDDNKADKPYLLFSGKLDMWVNRIIAKKLIYEIYPLIKKQIPDIKLLIVGSKPQKELLDVKTEGVEIIGNVKSLVPYLQNATVFLNPHIGGSGIQNKVLEAMSCGCPVVANKSGFGGIKAVNGENCLIAHSNEQFAELTVKLLKNPSLRLSIGLKARETIIKYHSPEIFNAELEKLIQNLIKKD